MMRRWIRQGEALRRCIRRGEGLRWWILYDKGKGIATKYSDSSDSDGSKSSDSDSNPETGFPKGIWTAFKKLKRCSKGKMSEKSKLNVHPHLREILTPLLVKNITSKAKLFYHLKNAGKSGGGGSSRS